MLNKFSFKLFKKNLNSGSVCKVWDRSVQPFYRDDETYIQTEIKTLYTYINSLLPFLYS